MPPLLGGIKVIHWSRVPRIVHQVSVVHSYNDNYLHVYICTHVSTVSQQLISRCIYCTQLIKALAVLATLVNSSCQLSFAAKLALLIHFHISLLCCKLQAFFFFLALCYQIVVGSSITSNYQTSYHLSGICSVTVSSQSSLKMLFQQQVPFVK